MEATEQRSKGRALQEQISGESAITAVQTREMQYRTRLSGLQAELDKLLLTYTDRHPDVIRVRHQMRDLEDEMHAVRQTIPSCSTRCIRNCASAWTTRAARWRPRSHA